MAATSMVGFMKIREKKNPGVQAEYTRVQWREVASSGTSIIFK
jgi:hypothetical protein